MATQLKSVPTDADPLDAMSLPGWLYHDPEFFEAEKRAFLRAAPQVVCHESEIAAAGRVADASNISARALSSFAATMARSAPLPMSAGTAARGWSMATAAAPRS